MAIRRCPYCKAIIDEKDKYCENCGTQLLFPEDEYEDEPIKGEKILDDEEQSEEEESGEELLEDKGESEEEKEEEDEDEEEETEEEEAEEKEETEEEETAEGDTGELNKFAEDQERQEEAYEEELDYGREEKEEFGEAEQGQQDEELTQRTPTQVVAEEEEKDEKELRSWMALKEEMAKKARPEIKEIPFLEFKEDVKEAAPAKVQEEDKKYQVSIEADELVFKTKELDQLTSTVEEGKEDVEKLLSAYEEEKQAREAKSASETRDELPPWLSGMKEAPPSITPDLEKEIGAEREPVRREWAVDSGIGIPERVTQTTTAFAETAAPAVEKHEERELEKEISGEEEARHPRGFSLKLKAKLVDLVFITALWLISLAFAAGVIGVSFFRIIFVAPLPVLAFFVLLLLLYFFLFLYFLGETLGDHYFSAED